MATIFLLTVSAASGVHSFFQLKFLNIFGISASNILIHVLKISLLTFLPVCFKRYTCNNSDLVNEKTCDVKLLSANFSQDAH